MLLAQKGEPSFAKGIWQRVAAWLHSKKEYKPEMLTEALPRELLKETFRVLNQPLQSLSVSQQIPPEISAALSRNTFIFSGFKTHCQLKEASLLLKDSDGNFKPFNRFLNDIQNIDSTYNHQYLHAEYNHAVSSTQMAVKWNDWQQDGDRYDLQYRTAGDALVREEHRLLDKTTLPISDPFWEKYLPPNGWNCRCTAVQVRKGKYPLSDSALAMQRGDNSTSLPKQQIFRFNPGKSLQVFPPKHPYFPKGCGTCNKNAHLSFNPQSGAYSCLSYNPQSDNCKACAAVQSNLVRQQGSVRRDEIKKEALEKINNPMWNESIKQNIYLYSRGIKEFLNQPITNYYEKNELLTNIEEVLNKAEYMGLSHYKKRLSHIFQIDFMDSKAWLIVHEEKGQRTTLYSISGNKKILEGIEKPT